MTKPADVGDSNWDSEVLQADKPVLVDFWAPWCGPCRMVAPIVEELADEYAGKAKVVKINVDEHADHALQYDVRHTPTVVFFRNGQEVDRIVGAGKKAHYTSKLDALLNY